ncbi:MAG: hypothetical protein ACLTFJ_03410 [Clostridium sp.]
MDRFVQEDVRQDGSAGAFFCTNWHIRKARGRTSSGKEKSYMKGFGKKMAGFLLAAALA